MSAPKFISIIVPVYNGAGHIKTTLDSIVNSAIDVPWELIVIDDGSTDNTPRLVAQFDCRYIRIEKSGVAGARNCGIRHARGEILFFFDADVTLLSDTLANFLEHFREHPEAAVIQGRWAKESPLKTFSSQFLLLKYSYNFVPLLNGQKRTTAANVETGCLGIRREVFEHCGMFDESFKRSGGEEHELGIRITERYPIYYYSDIFVLHAFGGLKSTMRKIYARTINFAMLAFGTSRKGFIKQHAVSVPDQDLRSVVLLTLFFIGLVIAPAAPREGLLMAALMLACYAINIAGFVRFMARQQGAMFALKGAAADMLIMLPRIAGLIEAVILYYIFGKRKYRI